MIETPDLIDALVADARPVRRLRPPLLRTALWLLLPALIFVLLALGQGVRPDLGQRLEQPQFVVGTGAALLTGVLAAVATFMLNLPDRARAWALLPLPVLVVWLGTLGYQCLVNWVSLGPDGVEVGETARCFATVLMTSVPLSVAMFAMLRRGSMLLARTASLTAGLAVAAMSATAISLFHRLDATAMVLLWNLGTTVLIVTLGGLLGRRMGIAR